MCGSEQGHAPDPKSLAAFGPGACLSLGAIALLNYVCDGFLSLYGTKKL